MNRTLRYVLFATFGVAAVGATTVFFLASRFDPNAYKPEIQRFVQEETGRKLTLEGDLKLRLFPSVAVEISRASLSERDGKTPFAAVSSARISLAVIPLLSQRAEVDQVRIDGLSATLVRHKDGRLNIDDLVKPRHEDNDEHRDEKREPRQKNGGHGNDFQLAIDGLQISDSRLRLIDHQNSRDIDLSAFSLSTGSLGHSARGDLSLAGQLKVTTGNAAAETSKLRLTAGYDIDTRRKAAALANLQASIEGQLAGLQLNTARLSAQTLRLTQKGDATLGGLLLDMDANGRDGSIVAKVDIPQLSLGGQSATSETAKGQIRLRHGEQSIKASFQLEGLSNKEGTLRVQRASLNAEHKTGNRELNVGIDGSLQIQPGESLLAFDPLKVEFGLRDPAMPAKGLTLSAKGSGRVDLKAKRALLALEGQFDNNPFSQKLQVLRFDPLSLAIEARFAQLDIDRYVASAPDTAATNAPDASKDGKPTAGHIDLSALKTLNASGHVEVDQLKARGIKASQIRLDFKLQNGILDLSPLAANLYGGSLTGSARVDAKRNRMSASPRLNDVSIGPLLRDAVQKDALEGRARISADLTTQGDTTDSLRRALAGKARVVLADGAIKGIDLAKRFRDIKGAFKGRDDASQAADSQEKTDFSELSASFNIAKGVARNDDLAGKSPFFRIGGAGNIDIGESQLDYLAKVSVVNTSTGQGGKELGQMAGLTVPVRLTGPFDNPSYRIEYSQLIGEATRQKVEAAVERKKDKVEDKLKDKLKGLFRK